jgi:hypothetical protein
MSGQAANKYKFVMKDKSAGGFLWYTNTGIPVKMDVLSKTDGKTTRMTVTLENIQIGPQDPAAFEVPANYTALPGGGMFGALGSAGGNSTSTNKSRRGLLGGSLLGGLTDAITRPVKNEAIAIAGDVASTVEAVAAPEQAVANAAEATVADEVERAGVKATVSGALRSVTGLLRKR